MSAELEQHEGAVGPANVQTQDRPVSTCTNFPTSSSFTDYAQKLNQGRPDSTCTQFPTNSLIANNNYGSIQRDTPNRGVSHQDINDVSEIQHPQEGLLETGAGNPSTPLQGQKRASQTERRQGKRLAALFCTECDPWKVYSRVATLGKSGTTYLALGPLNSLSVAKLVVVKEQRLNNTAAAQKVMRASHKNVVGLTDACLFAGKVFIVYERMDVSLSRLNSCCVLKEEHIAAICREVLEGLDYIHRELDTSIQEPLFENTFLDYSGHVKIGNVGVNLMSNPPKQAQQDIRSVGNLMLHLMQPGTMFRDPDEENVKSPHKWGESQLQFLNATRSSTIDNLLKHSFLANTPLHRIMLAPLVWEADKRVNLHWRKAV